MSIRVSVFFATKSPRSAKTTAIGADKSHADTLATYDEAVDTMKLYEADGAAAFFSKNMIHDAP